MTDIAALESRIRTLEAELTVVSFERDQLQNERDAVRVYFGGTKVGDVLERNANPARSGLSDENVIIVGIRKIVEAYPGQKIRMIKALRDSDDITEAWLRLGGPGVHKSAGTLGRNVYFDLKQAKDIIDLAEASGVVNLPLGEVRIA